MQGKRRVGRGPIEKYLILEGIGKKPLNNEKESGRGWTTKPVNRKLCQRKRSTETKDGVITGWTLFLRLDMVRIKAAWVGVVFE